MSEINPVTEPGTPTETTPAASEARQKWRIFGVLFAVLAGVTVLLLLLGGGGSREDYQLTIERLPGAGGREELVVSVPEAVNAPTVAKGNANVGLVCRDASGQVVFRTQLGWPFQQDPGFDEPHNHQTIPAQVDADSIATCRLTGTSIGLSGEITRTNERR